MPRAQVLSALLERGFRGVSLGLERMETALTALGRPEERFDAVHVAGSNGKGSVSAMVESVARRAGLRTGMYSSPHLCRFSERIRIGGEPIEDALFEDTLERVLGSEPADLTFFETLTATAFEAFRRANVELAVVEVGLGGRFDATNTLTRSLATAVTTISKEHTNVLGDDEAQIAREKAGIFRAGVPAVWGPVSDRVRDALQREADQRGASPCFGVRPGSPPVPSHDITVWAEPSGVTVVRPPAELGSEDLEVVLSMAGEHQRHNAAVAAGLCWSLRDRFPAVPGAMAEGLAAARWPGRLETIAVRGGEVSVLLDCAHNPQGVEALCRHLEGTTSPEAEVALVFGALREKDWRDGLAALSAHCRRRYYASPLGRPAAELADLVAVAEGEPLGDGPRAVDRAIERAPAGGTVLVTGSIYLVGQIRAHLLGISPDPVVAL